MAARVLLLTLLAFFLVPLNAHPPHSRPYHLVTDVQDFAPGTWLENLVVRRDGRILVTTLFPSARIYEIDPYTKSKHLVAEASSVTGFTGIVESYNEPDVFYFNGVDFNGKTFEGKRGSCGLWKLDLRDRDHLPRQAELVLSVPDAVNLNGLAQVGDGIFLVADWQGGKIFRLDINSKVAEVVMENEWTQPPNGGQGGAGGVNGMKVRDGWLYFSTNSKDALVRVRFNSTGYPVGQVDELFAGTATDDLWVDEKGGIFMVDGASKIAHGRVGGREPQIVVDGLASPTAVALGRDLWDRNILYVTTGGYYAYKSGNASEKVGLVAIEIEHLH